MPETVPSAQTSARWPQGSSQSHCPYVSLGCAAENLVQAAQALGLRGEVHFDPARDAVMEALSPAPAGASPWFKAITERQCTRGLYDGMPLSTQDLVLLERAGSNDRVRLLLLTDTRAIGKVLDYVVQGNSLQLNDKAFVNELKSWIRSNSAEVG